MCILHYLKILCRKSIGGVSEIKLLVKLYFDWTSNIYYLKYIKKFYNFSESQIFYTLCINTKFAITYSYRTRQVYFDDLLIASRGIIFKHFASKKYWISEICNSLKDIRFISLSKFSLIFKYWKIPTNIL